MKISEIIVNLKVQNLNFQGFSMSLVKYILRKYVLILIDQQTIEHLPKNETRLRWNFESWDGDEHPFNLHLFF